MNSLEEKIIAILFGFVCAAILGLSGYRILNKKIYLSILVIGIIFYMPLSVSFDYDVDLREHTLGLSFYVCDFMLLAYLLNFIRLKKKFTWDTPLLKIMFLYVLLILVSIFIGLGHRYALEFYALFLVVKCVILYFVMYMHFEQDEDYSNFISILSIIFIALGLWGLYEKYFQQGVVSNVFFGFKRVFTFFEHPNLAGTVNIMAFAFLLTIFLSGEKLQKEQRFLLLSGVVGAMLGSLLTMSMSVMALIAVAIISIVILSYFYHFDRGSLYRSSLLVMLIFLGFVMMSYQDISSRLGENGVIQSVLEQENKFDSGGRGEMNYLAVDIFLQHPFGIGYNSFPTVSSLFGGDGLTASYTHDGLPPVHNFFLLTLVELGFLGVIVYGVIIVVPCLRYFSLVKMAYRRNQTGTDLEYSTVTALASFNAIMVMYAHQMVESTLRSPPVMYLFFLLLAILMKSPYTNNKMI